MIRILRRFFLTYVTKAPPVVWVLLGFSISYLLFFIRPIFFSSQTMLFPKYVPAVDPIGTDLDDRLRSAEAWLVARQDPYFENPLYAYPPLTSLLVMPLLLVKFSSAYALVTLSTVLGYVLISFVFPLSTGGERHVSPILILIFITGLFSYGFQFELERGQFNLIAVSVCFLAIWIYHFHNRYRLIAYFLFTISVQLKVFPFIFIVMLIDNWQDWKNNIKRVLVLISVNLALLFVLGPIVFINFVKAILSQIVDPPVWTGNHSISSFVAIISKIAYDHGWVWVKQYSGWVNLILLVIILIFIFLIMFQIYRQKQTGLNPYLLLACSIGALIIPSASNDYTLSFLAAPVAVLLSSERFLKRENSPRQQLLFIELLFILSVAYSSTLLSYTNKPLMVNNNFPALFIMLAVITLLSFTPKQNFEVIVIVGSRSQ